MQQTDLDNPINCPTIFSSTMTFEKAKHIMALVVHVSFKSHGISDHENAQFPMEYSLEEICIASRVMKAHQKAMERDRKPGETLTIQLNVDDRGIAAHYALAHYHNNPESLLQAVGFSLGNDENE